MSAQSDRLGRLAAELRAVWLGETAGAYLGKLKAFGERLRADAKLCREAAADFHAKIAEIQAAEAEAENTPAKGREDAAALPVPGEGPAGGGE
jgi:hypothetical protein